MGASGLLSQALLGQCAWEVVQMIYGTPATGRKQALTGDSKSIPGRGEGSISHMLPSIPSASLPLTSPQVGAQRMEMVFSLG